MTICAHCLTDLERQAEHRRPAELVVRLVSSLPNSERVVLQALLCRIHARILQDHFGFVRPAGHYSLEVDNLAKPADPVEAHPEPDEDLLARIFDDEGGLP